MSNFPQNDFPSDIEALKKASVIQKAKDKVVEDAQAAFVVSLNAAKAIYEAETARNKAIYDSAVAAAKETYNKTVGAK